MSFRFIEIRALRDGAEFAHSGFTTFKPELPNGEECAMATQRKSGILVFVMTLATTLIMASTAMTATPEPTAPQPKTEATAPLHTPEIKEATAPSVSDQVNSEKQEKKKSQRTGMLITLFAVITGHQGATR
jgi:hypothetical protein